MADWAGQFGNDYTQRWMDIPDRSEFWNQVLPKDVTSAFEIGCNWGANLVEIEKHGVKVFGCDVNAIAVAKAKSIDLCVAQCHGLAATIRADLVFTSGVLIHRQTYQIIEMMKHMRDLTKHYVLFNEYYSELDHEIKYRGLDGALFKRDFGKIYEALFPQDVLVKVMDAGEELGMDDTRCWIYERSNSTS